MPFLTAKRTSSAELRSDVRSTRECGTDGIDQFLRRTRVQHVCRRTATKRLRSFDDRIWAQPKNIGTWSVRTNPSVKIRSSLPTRIRGSVRRLLQAAVASTKVEQHAAVCENRKIQVILAGMASTIAELSAR
jgi:hypothetical protein